MHVVIFGATGMVGAGVLRECLADPRVASVLVVGRSGCGVAHPKLTEVIHGDLFDLSPLEERFRGKDACFFCLGVSSFRMSEAEYHRLTHDLTLGAARLLAQASPAMTFCYVTGVGTDSTERGRTMWARVKGKTENRLLELPFRAVYLFRPGYIQPLDGIRSKTRLYQAMYDVVGFLYPLMKRVLPHHLTTTRAVGRAMIQAAAAGYHTPFLETPDINALSLQAERTSASSPSAP